MINKFRYARLHCAQLGKSAFGGSGGGGVGAGRAAGAFALPLAIRSGRLCTTRQAGFAGPSRAGSGGRRRGRFRNGFGEAETL